tara:strand:+ start:1387 stop:2265 length:879 start_codon:yes stop_codon:yes gene_type:complete
MLDDQIRLEKPLLITSGQKEEYLEDGAVLIESIVSETWLKKIRRASDEIIERSRKIEESNSQYILEEGHSKNSPRLKRLSSPVDHHSTFWDFISNEISSQLAADVVGPNVKYHHSKLNYKWANGGTKFDWHQDIQSWPHTDYSPVTLALFLNDCTSNQGPLLTIKGSHRGPLFSMYDKNENWVLSIPEAELDLSLTKKHTGPAGSVLLLNCRTIHGSEPNNSNQSRPMLLSVYSSADSIPYTHNPIPSPYAGTIVQGKSATWASHDPRPCQLPPDWSTGYVGPWVHQDKERQ